MPVGTFPIQTTARKFLQRTRPMPSRVSKDPRPVGPEIEAGHSL